MTEDENMKKLSKEMILLIIFVLIFAILSVMSPGKFLSMGNIRSMCFQIPEFGLFAIAMMLAILTGGINLSVITSGTLGSILGALVLSRTAAAGMMPQLSIALTILVVLLTSTICGLINGLVVSYVGTAAMMTTLGTSTLYEGIGLLISKGNSISKFPTEFYWFGNGSILGMPVPMYIFVIAAVIVYLLLQRTPWGLSVYMVGSNPKTTMYSGINVPGTMTRAYVLSGLLSGIAAVIMMSRYNSARIDYGSSYLMQTVAASVLGGTLITGGYGKVIGVVIAVVTLQCISSGLNIFGLDTSLTSMITGFVLIATLSLNYLAGRRGESGGKRKAK